MNAQTALRRELHSYIDIISIRRLSALKPLLVTLAESEYVIETDLTARERTILAETQTEYDENPKSFLSLEEYCKSRGIGYSSNNQKSGH